VRHWIALQVNDALRIACRAGGVREEGEVIAARRRRRERLVASAEELLEIEGVGRCRRSFTDDDDMLERRTIRANALEDIHQATGRDGRDRLGIVEAIADLIIL